jgi:methyltransferase
VILSILLLVFVTLQRAAELVWNRSNERGLKARGAVEAGRGHYPVMVALHGLWLVALWIWGWDRPIVWGWFAAYVLLQLGRVWVLATLGRRWTTRVFVIPGETLVRRGPYRFVSHPNYVVVVLEIFVLPLVWGLWGAALLFGLSNMALLAWRIRVENRALSAAVRA